MSGKMITGAAVLNAIFDGDAGEIARAMKMGASALQLYVGLRGAGETPEHAMVLVVAPFLVALKAGASIDKETAKTMMDALDAAWVKLAARAT